MTKYYDRSGIEISSAKIRCVDSVKVLRNILFVFFAINAMVGESVSIFIEVAVWLVKPRVTASKRPALLTR